MFGFPISLSPMRQLRVLLYCIVMNYFSLSHPSAGDMGEHSPVPILPLLGLGPRSGRSRTAGAQRSLRGMRDLRCLYVEARRNRWYGINREAFSLFSRCNFFFFPSQFEYLRGGCRTTI